MFNLTLPENLITGVEKIDRQHLTLIITFDNIISSIDSDQANDEVENLINFLVSYTNIHFEEEEAIMREAGYTGLEAHMKEHENFRLKVETMQKATQLTSENKEINKKMVSEAKEWILNHVFKVDIAMAKLITASK